MKFFARLLLFAVVLMSLVVRPNMANAQSTNDYVAAAVEALQTSSVYIYPGTPGTNPNTYTELGTFLKPELNVVLVVLPEEALSQGDIYLIAEQISRGLNHQKTVGVAIGNLVTSYSAILPIGVVSDKMDRAKSVSSNPITTLIIFSQNISKWYLENPPTVATPTPKSTRTPWPTIQPIKLPKAEEIGWPIWTCVAIFLVLLFAFLTKAVRSGIESAKEEEKRQKRYDGLENLRQKIQAIEIDIDQILDRKIKKDLQGAILLAYGLIDILEEHSSYIGMTESLTPEMIKNMGKQVKALLRHESGRRPMSDELYVDLTEALMNYDSLFKTLQADDPEGAELLASVIHTKTTIISRQGYLE